MKGYRVNGGLKRGSTVVLAACFLLGSSITSLAAGDGVTYGYEGLVDTSEVKDVTEVGDYGEMGIDDESLQEFARAYDLDPEDVVIIYDDIETYGSRTFIWTVPAGKTYVAANGISADVGDTVAITVKGTPNTVEYQTGLQEPDFTMWGVQGKGTIFHNFTIRKKGTHYFFVTNLSKTTDLDVTATAIW